ncbi:serine/threonine-protein kinase [Acrocarpospora catenulata]|uniref:serine/threonine-protein kinase n=1 Tax=Acrocarpospora catenulata TaxID=2836182 RepID=UPI001BDACC12|nr:serine/threonine-protein kinase [Acrocarpospora catenulata]
MNQDDRLGPYRLLRRLGEGGMGVVHLALDPHGRQVAVKVLRPEVAGDDTARRRLSREVETMRRVRNRHIAEVVDADVTGQRPYIVTRYVPGRPLDEIVKQDGPLSVDALLRVAGGVAEALAAVHAAGVIHRDLKPGNVLMLDGDPVLIDFGIAQAVDATRLTQTGMFIGTPGYLAPEIIEGNEAGPEVDVHAWAGTLLYAATGLPPFGKGTLEMIFFNITSGKANVDAAPPVIQPVLRAALQRDPARRPRAADLRDQVARLLPHAHRPRVPDEVTTVPNVDETTGKPIAVLGLDGPPPVPRPPSNQQVNQPVAPLRPADPLNTPMVPREPSRDFVSLLGEAPSTGQVAPPPPNQGDPFPTVRVTGEDLRRAGLSQPEVVVPPPDQGLPKYEPPTIPKYVEGDIPTRMAPPSLPSGPNPWPPQPPPPQPQPQSYPQLNPQLNPQPGPDGDVPTRRVRPEELRHSIPQQPFFEQAPEIYEQTPHVNQPHPVPFQQTVRVPPPAPPYNPSVRPGAMLQRSRAYGVASALMLVAMTAAAAIAPVLVALVVLPAVALFRAADLAQSELNARRPIGEAAADVFRVLAFPGPLVKSIATTLGLVLYGLILGVPVTLLLAVLVTSMDANAALAWGVAVALWAICAGPAVEGPTRQVRRTLASLFPTRGAAIGVAWGIGVLALLLAGIALLSIRGDNTVGLFWGVDIGEVISRLDDLRSKGPGGS